MGEGGRRRPSPNPHPRKNFYNGPWHMLRLVFFVLGANFFIYAALGHKVSPSGEVWDAFPAWGKGGLLGAVPLLGPLCTPPGAPLRAFSASAKRRGHASCAAGASFPRCAQSGDLPPRRVNARKRFHFDQNPLQPNTNGKVDDCNASVASANLNFHPAR